MEAPAPTPRSRSRILGRSSVFGFIRSLVGSKVSLKISDEALAGGQQSPLSEQDAVSQRAGHQEGVGRRQPGPPATLSWALTEAARRGSSHLPLHDASGLGMGDMGAQNPSSKEVLSLMAQGVKMTSVSPGGSQEVLGHLAEEEREEEEEPAGGASGEPGTSDRSHFAQALEEEQEGLQRTMELLALGPTASTTEEEQEEAAVEEEGLLDGVLKLASSKARATPWNHLLSLYKQLQNSAVAKGPGLPQFPIEEGLPPEEKAEEEEMEEEDSSFDPCVPRIITLQSPLHKTLRSTDTMGFVDSELKKLLEVQQESCLCKVGSLEGQELLTEPEITLEEVGVVDDEGHQAEGIGGRSPVFGECWGPGEGVRKRLKFHPGLEGRVQSPLGMVSGTKDLLLEEMDEVGSCPLD